jgi:hypothetical protein
MKTISSFRDLDAYGIDALTGEACGLGYRILCDLTENGRKVLAKVFGVPQFAITPPWNSGTKSDPHIGSVLLAHEMLVPLAVIALLDNGCKEVWLVRDGGVIGIEPDDSADMIEANRHLVGDRLLRTLAYRGTAAGGDRNTHVMSGRVE